MKVASLFLEKIKSLDSKGDNLFDYHSECLLILCHSIPDYVVYDFLSSMSPNLSMEEISEINRKKYEIIKNPKILKVQFTEILKFFQKFIKEKESLLKEPLIQYFFAVRNRIIHGEFSNFYKTISVDGKEVKRFQTDFVDFSLINDEGDFLVINDEGDSLELSNRGSILEFEGLKNLSEKEKAELIVTLQEEDPLELFEFYLIKIYEFIQKFA